MWPTIRQFVALPRLMNYRFIAGLLVAFHLPTVVAFAQNQYYLPQIANGNYGSGIFRTTFVLVNNTSANATATLELSDDGANPLTMNLAGKTAGRFEVTLAAGAVQMLRSDGKGSLVSGAAKVTSTAKIGVSAILSVFDAGGKYLAETGIGSSEPMSSFVLPVDTTGNFNTGLALVNPAETGASVTVTLRDTSGLQVGSPAVLTLPPRGHVARFIYGTGQLFPSIGNFQGTLLVQSSQPIASTVLRQNASPLSYTSLPGVSTASARQTLNLAQVANGSYGSGSYRTSFLIFNLSSSPADVNLNLTDDSGQPLSLTIMGWGRNSAFAFPNLPPGASLFLQTDGTGDLTAGAATITSNVPAGASGIYTLFNSLGSFQSETGVGCASVLTSLTLPVDLTGSFDTGVAFFGAAGSESTLTLQLSDAQGGPLGASVRRTVPANGHLGIFVSQLFPGISNFTGSLSVSATTGIAALALRANTSPLLFTALPVSAGIAAPGGGARFTMADTISDQAQSTTVAFSAFAMMTGNLESQTFFPPGKVADYTGFQYLRDNDPDGMGHNTSFLTRIANNVIYLLSDAQFAQLKTLAVAQLEQINLCEYKRFPLMKAFRRVLESNVPTGSPGLNLNAVKKASRELYLLDGQISFDRAALYAGIIKSLDSSQKAYLDAMKGKGWKSWPDITDDQIRARMQGLPQGTAVAVMTYAGDLFSWYAGSVDADVYFCPERQGTYYGSFYIKDAPAIGHEGYSINEQLTATTGAALVDASKGYVTQDQAAVMSSLVDKQRDNLYASPSSNIVKVRTEIATLLRSLLTTSASSDVVKAQVLSLSGTYGDLDGENNYHYATVFAQVYKTLTSDQKARLAALRKSIMSGTYSDGTPFDYSVCSTYFLYSSIIGDTGLLAPYLNNTDYLFFEP